MNRFAAEHPEDYEERLEAMAEGADLERKRRRENPEVYRMEGRIPMERLEWFHDPVRIARLLRWLQLLDREPRDLPLFVESAASYSDEYEAMRAAEQGVGT